VSEIRLLFETQLVLEVLRSATYLLAENNILTRKLGSEAFVATLVSSTDMASLPDVGLLNRTCPPPCYKTPSDV